MPSRDHFTAWHATLEGGAPPRVELNLGVYNPLRPNQKERGKQTLHLPPSFAPATKHLTVQGVTARWGKSMLPLNTFQGPAGCFRARTAAQERAVSSRQQPVLETVEGVRPSRNITQRVCAFSSVQAQAEPGPSTSGQTGLCEAESQSCRPGLVAESLVHKSVSGWAESLAVSGLWYVLVETE